jgi:hypothetical protein
MVSRLCGRAGYSNAPKQIEHFNPHAIGFCILVIAAA